MLKTINQKIKRAFKTISTQWDQDIIPQLKEFIRIPNKSPAFDANWKTNGYMDQAMKLLKNWCEQQPIQGMTIKFHEAENRTPLLFIEIAGKCDETILLYGHMDKQPEMKGWRPDLGPWKPVLKDEKLYGRGGADDGYSVFCALSAIATLQRLDIPHSRCVVIIEASEESGSIDLPFYLTGLNSKIGTPSLVICLDSECGNYEQLWGTTSLRGLLTGNLKIEVLRQGIHSGYGGGIVPTPFCILRELLDRIEQAKTGKILLEDFQVKIPEYCIQQAQEAAKALGSSFYKAIPFQDSVQPITQDIAELILNRTWRSALSIIGANGLPLPDNAGNVTLPDLEVKLSIRMPPTCDTEKASQILKNILEKDPPHKATVTFTLLEKAQGWHSPPLADWLTAANEKASQTFFNSSAAYLGTGGCIPFIAMLGEMFPKAQFLITGVLGPNSNAHGPNEFLHIPMAKKLTGCVASVIAAHYVNFKR